MSRISAYILAYNEEEKIAAAVKSVDWVDEIIVADSGSQDRTVEIAERLGARVVQIPFSGFGKLRNDAVAACSHPWVFSLDADERCTVETRDEILGVINDVNTADAYYIPRRNWFMGRWIRYCGWYPNYRQPQLFQRGALKYNASDEVHEGFEVHGRVSHLKHPIWQIPFKSFEQMLDKSNRYSSLGVEKLDRRGVKGSMSKALLHAMGAFFRIYILKRGFLDGWPGFVIAMANFEGTFFYYAKLCWRHNQWSNSP